MVSLADLVKLLMSHSKMKAVGAEAYDAFLQRETGSAEGLMRAAAAATEPTAGQAMLQRDNGGVAAGESRTQESRTMGEHGEVHVERVVERVVELPNGQSVHVQQLAQSVHVNSRAAGMAGDLASLISNSITPFMIEYVGSRVEEEAVERRSKDNELEENDKELSARLSTLEAGMARSLKKPRTYWSRSDHPEMPKNIFGRDGRFSWKKVKNKKSVSKHGFESIEEAVANMQAHVWVD